MSAVVLRRAASLMRERATAATNVTGASDWFAETRGMHFAGEFGIRSSGGFVAGDTSEEEAEHIASWHPAVALAVADWLDDLAYRIVLSRQLRHEDEERAALAVARAYLGEPS